MNTNPLENALGSSIQHLRRGARDALRTIFPTTLRRRLMATGAAAALAATSLLSAQPVAADTTYPVKVTFDNVKFTSIDDGCVYQFFDMYCETDYHLEVYGGVGAYTTAGAVSAGGSPWRNIGRWGQSPCTVPWTADDSMTCTKDVTISYYYFNNVYMCDGSSYSTLCSNYAKMNNSIPLQVHAGEQFKVTIALHDYDWGSSDDNVCVASTWFGPYTAAQLQAKTYIYDVQNHPLNMGWNGNAECFVAYHLN
jgi:hypothetical protein